MSKTPGPFRSGNSLVGDRLIVREGGGGYALANIPRRVKDEEVAIAMCKGENDG